VLIVNRSGPKALRVKKVDGCFLLRAFSQFGVISAFTRAESLASKYCNTGLKGLFFHRNPVYTNYENADYFWCIPKT
jgi:hypothetical protein